MNIGKKIGLIVGTISVPIAFFDTIGYPSFVIGSSMEPTLSGDDSRWWRNDIIWMSQWVGNPKKDHIYSFNYNKESFKQQLYSRYPRDPKRIHIKRLKYKSGDLVRRENPNETTIVPQDHFWMVSDNHDTGNDSYNYGPIPRGLIKAEAKYIIWPYNRIGKIK